VCEWHAAPGGKKSQVPGAAGKAMEEPLVGGGKIEKGGVKKKGRPPAHSIHGVVHRTSEILGGWQGWGLNSKMWRGNVGPGINLSPVLKKQKTQPWGGGVKPGKEATGEKKKPAKKSGLERTG